MRPTAAALLLATTVALPAAAGTSRTLSATVPAAALARVSLEVGVGDVHVTAVDADAVQVTVVLTPRRGGLFSSLRRGEAEVAAATLERGVVGDVLRLQVSGPSDDRRFEEDWTVQMPARLKLKLEAGVGEITVRGVAGGIDLDAGVGDVRVDVPGGDLVAEVGVGDLEVSAPAAAYGPVSCSAGVGDATIHAGGRSLDEGGFVGKSAEWHGAGPASIQAESGVGDVTVTLSD